MKTNFSFKELFKLFRKNLTLTIALMGFVSAVIFSLTLGQPSSLPPHQLTLPATSPFDRNISGTGLVEANTRNISIGSFVTGVVAEVFVKEGDVVKQGDPLFCLDYRTEAAQVAVNEKQLKAAKDSIAVAEASLAEAQDLFQRTQSLKPGVLSQEEIKRRTFDVQKAEAQLALEKTRYEQEQKQLALAKVNLEKLTVKAPVSGLILKVRINPGEYINMMNSQTLAPITLGNHQPLNVRVQIDENDAWRFQPGAKAIAYLRGNKNIHFPLHFIRLEPYAQSKQQLTGDTQELIDTRVIEIVYQVEGEAEGKLLIGQQMDVFIETEKSYE